MKTKKYLKKIHQHEKVYEQLKKRLQNHPLLIVDNTAYLKSEKQDFLLLWKDVSQFLQGLQKDVQKLKIRKFFLMHNYNAFVLKKYYLVLYFNTIMEIEDVFGSHDDFIRNLLSDNFKKDFSYYAEYIYKPHHITVINTPNIFLRAFKTYIHKDIFHLLDPGVIQVSNTLRLGADYNNLFYTLKYRYDKLMYAVVKKIGGVIARTRFSKRKKGYITEENLEKYLQIAKPGDIFLTRGNWNASNIGIPGFWKHMSMYIGTGKYLKKHFSKKYSVDLGKDSHYIIEATGEGIMIKDINEIVKVNDYLGVSRPTFSEEKIQRSIKNSFQYIGSQYDFIFNFYSDKNLVCSELILKSYAREDRTDEGIDVRLEHVGSGIVFPPNNFIQLLYDESKKKQPTVKPLFFIDSIEKTGENFVASSEDFLESGKRSRFSFGLR